MGNRFSNKYQERWEARGTIRTRPRKFIDFSLEGYFFPEERQPLLLHEAVTNLGLEVKKHILLKSFYKYLNDIVNLEIKLINSVCIKIIYSDLVIEYDDDVKLNANTIIIDEFYHVYMAKDMIWQLKRHFVNSEKIDYPTSDSYNAVKVIKGKLDKKYHDIFEIIAVCIFETTLVRELVEFFNSDNVHPSIKYYVNDHMNDEAKHFGFFYDLLTETWGKLPADYKDNIGKHLANFIKLYLNVSSDKIFNLDLLAGILKDQNKAIKIIDELYKGFDINPEIPIVKNVLSVLKKSGMLDNKNVKESFISIGWSV